MTVVIMTQLLPVALRGLLSENVRVPIVKLCVFLNAISQKVINLEDYDKFHEIPPFVVKEDPSILLNDEDTPWLRPTRS